LFSEKQGALIKPLLLNPFLASARPSPVMVQLFFFAETYSVTTRVSYTLLHPGFHFALKPAGAAPQLDRFREQPFADEFVEPFIAAVGVGSDECHINKLIIQQSR